MDRANYGFASLSGKYCGSLSTLCQGLHECLYRVTYRIQLYSSICTNIRASQGLQHSHLESEVDSVFACYPQAKSKKTSEEYDVITETFRRFESCYHSPR